MIFTNEADIFTFVVDFFKYVVDFYITNFFYICGCNKGNVMYVIVLVLTFLLMPFRSKKAIWCEKPVAELRQVNVLVVEQKLSKSCIQTWERLTGTSKLVDNGLVPMMNMLLVDVSWVEEILIEWMRISTLLSYKSIQNSWPGLNMAVAFFMILSPLISLQNLVSIHERWSISGRCSCCSTQCISILLERCRKEGHGAKAFSLGLIVWLSQRVWFLQQYILDAILQSSLQ